MDDDGEIAGHAVAFLRLRAIELRRIGDLDTGPADHLRHVSDLCVREAEILEMRFGIEPSVYST